MQLKTDKTPGQDGLSPEFYKVFYSKLKEPLYQMITSVYEDKELHFTLCTGVINLIPKLDKDSCVLKNLRPITLLNTDYKIIEWVITSRMEMGLESIIHMNQKGFMKNRQIAVNIRKVYDIIQYTKDKNI